MSATEPALPKQNSVQLPTLGAAAMNDIFDKIRKGLEKDNLAREKKGSNRFSHQFAPIRKTAAATKAMSSVSSRPRVSVESQSKSSDANRSVLFGSQLSSPMTSSWGLSCLPPVKKPAPTPLKFDPPSFIIGGSNESTPSPSSSLKRDINDCKSSGSKIVSDEAACDSSNQPEEIESSPESEKNKQCEEVGSIHSRITSQGSTQGQSSSNMDVSEPAAKSGKRKAFSFECYGSTYPPSDFPYYGMYSMHASPFAKEWSKEEVNDLVAFADRWITDVKKPRTGEK